MHTGHANAHTPTIGEGIYGLAEAARYASVHPTTARHWFLGRSDRQGKGPILPGDYLPIAGRLNISFLDLVDVLVVGRLREHGVTLSTVRNAYHILQRQLKTNHPFCHKELYTDGKRIWIATADELGNESLSEVVTRQHWFLHIRDCLYRLDYDPATSLAERWRIAEGVVIDPRISLGKPVVASTGVTTFVVANAYSANRRDAELVADLFGVGVNDVHRAVEFEKSIRGKNAA